MDGALCAAACPGAALTPRVTTPEDPAVSTPPPPPAPPPRVIKRYANRKLYDTGRSCYVTLEEIGVLVKAGQAVRIVDNRTGEDLSSVTLAQVVVEEEKKQRRGLPLSGLPNPLTAFLGRSHDAIEDLQRRLDERIHKVIETMTQLPTLQEEVTALRDRVAELEARIGELEASQR